MTDGHFDRKFRQLMELHELGCADEAFAALLREGPMIIDPLLDFIIEQENSPRLAVLVDLLGKMPDDRVIAVLMRFLYVGVEELRCSAAIGLAWHRARAAIEKLDELYGNDPSPRVREECGRAIEEILRDRPTMATLLHHHPLAQRPAAHGCLPVGIEPASDQERLIAALPRLLAIKYRAVPAAIPGDRLLVISVAPGAASAALEAHLSDLTGHRVTLQTLGHTDDIRAAIDHLYTHGDDDFAVFHQCLRPAARREVVAEVIKNIRPDEPLAPLPECDDAVAAVQAFLGLAVQMRARAARVERTADGLTVSLGMMGVSRELEAPRAELARRFVTALLVLADLAEAGEMEPERGTIADPQAPWLRAEVTARCQPGVGELLEFDFSGVADS